MILSFSKEIEVMRSLRHDNIVRYLGTSLDQSFLSVFLEYIPGGSISSLLGKFGAFSENVIKVYTKQILQGLSFLHANSIIHRDIKVCFLFLYIILYILYIFYIFSINIKIIILGCKYIN